MKNILSVAIIILFALSAKGQSQPTATQVVQAVMPNIITVSAQNANAPVTFASTTDFVDGKESDPQDFSVSSNKNWQLEMKSDANFVEGTSLANMPITGGLFKMKVLSSADYTISTGFDAYSQVTTTNQIIISTGLKGNGKTVTVRYKLTPGLTYPGGSYTNTVTYTATQL